MTPFPNLQHQPSRIDYEAVNRRGVTVHTFNDRGVGTAWIKDHSHLHDGLVLEAVEVVKHRRVVYRPRRLSVVGGAV